MLSRRLIGGLAAALLPLSALASPMTYEFSGVVSFGGGAAAPDGTFEPFIPPGTAFSGSFTYESDIPPYNQLPDALQYQGVVTAANISFGTDGSLGQFQFAERPYSGNTTQSSNVTIINDSEFMGNPPYDQFSLVAAMGLAPGDPANMYRYISFSTSDYSAQQMPPGFSLQDPLPLDVFLSGFHQFTFGWYTYDASGELASEFVGTQQLTMRQAPTAVPEPGTPLLFGAALAGLWLATRRRRAPRYHGAGL